jgi:hypothetical protein
VNTRLGRTPRPARHGGDDRRASAHHRGHLGKGLQPHAERLRPDSSTDHSPPTLLLLLLLLLLLGEQGS